MCVHADEFSQKYLAIDATHCKGEQGFDRDLNTGRGRCVVRVVTKSPCELARKVLQHDGVGCQTATACVLEGYRTLDGQCVDKVATDCGNRDGFESGKCIAAGEVKTAQQCKNRDSESILNAVGVGAGACQARSDCTDMAIRLFEIGALLSREVIVRARTA